MPTGQDGRCDMRRVTATALVVAFLLALAPTAQAGSAEVGPATMCTKHTFTLDDGTTTTSVVCITTYPVRRDPPRWTSPPEWCSLDGKRDYWAWWWAVEHADRALMYEVCAQAYGEAFERAIDRALREELGES